MTGEKFDACKGNRHPMLSGQRLYLVDEQLSKHRAVCKLRKKVSKRMLHVSEKQEFAYDKPAKITRQEQ